MNNIFVLDKNYNKIGTLSNQGVKPLAPYFNDLFVQDLETGADTYEFSTISNSYTQGCIEIGNHIMFAYRNRNELFTITSIEHSHNEGYKTVGVYAESVGFELLDIYMEKPKTSGSSGGTDNDNDGDDNYDDEYADVDDIYIDENGNIIYDKDGSGLGDVTIDGDGNIIYKPKNNKKYKDRPSDYLEFKNISYPTFIKMILKNTGWSCVCQPGLENNKQDMRVSYDTNIYAILQNSMQDYKGVELEFRYEYNNGKVTKTVYAYNNGGRGSFIGKRFVYGQNVKGITKTQEVTHEKDDAIIFVDDIGVEVRYDVDFALKSAEVPEIEIGDTHYVIDSDFHPPMQIKARIGKIEVSFSDPTRNKIYLANNKKMKGSLVDDGLDNYSDDDGEGHNRLVCDCWDNTTVMEFHGSYSPDYPDFIPGDNVPEGEIQFRTSYMNVDFHITDDDEFGWAKPRIYRYNTAYDNMTNIFTDSYHVDPCIDDSFHLGRLGYAWKSGFINHISSKDIETNTISSYRYTLPFDRRTMNDVSKISNSTKQDLLDFIINDVNVYKYMPKETAETTGTYLGLLSEDFIDHESDTECVWTSEMAHLIMRNVLTSGGQHYNEHCYNLSALVCALIAAFQHYVGGNSPNAPSNPGTGDGNTPGSGNYATVEYVDSQVGAVLELKPAIIDFIELKPAIIDFIELKPAIIDLIENGSGGGGGTSGCIFEKVSDNFYYTDNDIQIERDLYVNGTLHINSGDGMGMGIVDCDILKVVEIQFANGTKLPVNNIATVSELSEYATVEALQEEVRIKDEQIANLEARLARLEALLDNNNN